MIVSSRLILWLSSIINKHLYKESLKEIPTDSQLRLVLRSSKYIKYLSPLFTLIMLLATILVFRTIDYHNLSYDAIILIIIIIVIVLWVSILRNTKIIISDLGIEQINILGINKSILRSEIAEIHFSKTSGWLIIKDSKDDITIYRQQAWFWDLMKKISKNININIYWQAIQEYDIFIKKITQSK